MLEYSIVAGITASGADAYMLHVTTTPSVSYVTRQDEFDCGIMITASHNPFYDNGIKVINTVTKQIALSHTYGNGKEISCRNTADSVSELLYGMQIDHFISLTMDSVGIYNDLVGGVEVTVLDDFKGIDDTLIKGEKVLLKSKHALNYVRTRYGLDDSSNNNRMNRQQQYVNALFEKSKKITEKNDEFIIDASLKMADYIVSDRSVTQLQELAKKIVDYK